MDEDLIPDVAQAERLAHSIASIKGRATHISDRYSHVSEPMRQQLVAALQKRWEGSLGPEGQNRPFEASDIAGASAAVPAPLGGVLPNSSHRRREDHRNEK
ncbi:hypothetical protein [Nonomuraea polychroma]|uniref:hypothetical protein n=1 Tax=Nonomuraea polychroma TaxID=46176 RepID=UPI000FDE5D25|nr:hypothetical protein [Nonomuraea polychroma]